MVSARSVEIKAMVSISKNSLSRISWVIDRESHTRENIYLPVLRRIPLCSIVYLIHSTIKKRQISGKKWYRKNEPFNGEKLYQFSLVWVSVYHSRQSWVAIFWDRDHCFEFRTPWLYHYDHLRPKKMDLFLAHRPGEILFRHQPAAKLNIFFLQPF